MMKRVGIILIIVLTLSGCGRKAGGPEGQKEITFACWMYGEKASGGQGPIDRAIERFEKLHPGVTVKPIGTPYEETQSQLITRLAAKNAPDVSTVDVVWLQSLAAMRGFEPLDTYIPAEMKADMHESSLELGTYDGSLVALTWNPNPNFLICNKVVMKKAGLDPNHAPVDMAELQKDIQATKKLGAGYYGFATSTADKNNFVLDYFTPWLWSFGGEVVTEDGKPAIASPQAVAAVDWYKSMAVSGMMPAGRTVRDTRTLFANDKVAFTVEGPWIAGVYRSVSGKGKAYDDNWFAAPIPGNVREPGWSFPSHHMLVMASTCKNKKEAWEFMRFMATDKQFTKEYYDATGLLPVLKSQLTSPEFAGKVTKVTLAQLERCRAPRAWSKNYDRIADAVVPQIRAAMEGADAKVAMEKAAGQMERLGK